MSCDAKCSAYERPRSYKNMVKRFVFEHECTPPEWIAVSSPTDSVLYQTTAREKKSLRGMCFPYVLSAPHWKHDNAEKWVVLLSLSLSFFFCVLVSCHLPESICSGTEAMQNKTAVGLSPHGRWQPFSISYQSEQKLFHESQHLPHAEGHCSKLRAVPARLTDWLVTLFIRHRKSLC